MTDNRSPTEGTIRDARPGEPLDGDIVPRISLSVLNVSHERFRIIKTYAQGGLGVVSIAHDVELDRMVAVKEMRIGRPSDDDIQRFLLEARLTGQLDHPGIPPVYALGYFEDGRPFYAMRLVEGITLRDAIKEFHARYPAPDRSRQRSMQLRQLIGAIVSVCNTLRFAHSNGVLHRDIKPSNIMLGEYGETLLMDWGLAKSQKQSLPYSELEAKAHQQRKRLDDPDDTGTGSVMGTPPYMSPEQAHGDVESINQRSEVYSVGATLFSVLTGKPPFTGQTREAVLEKVRRGEFQSPRSLDSRVPPELNAICLKAMSLERGDRYADTGELAIDIEHWLADESVSCYHEPPSRRWQRWARAHQAWVAGLAALMLTCFVGLLIGGYLVSIKHVEAAEARSRADEAAETAATITHQSRELLSRTFVTTFNRRMRNIPGTERTRLEILGLFIDQFEKWSASDSTSFHDRLDLAHAIYERSNIYNELNEIDLAWADMQVALHILDHLMQTPDHHLRNSLVLDRLKLLADMTKLQREFASDVTTAESMAQRVLYFVQRETDTNSQSAACQLHFAEALLQLGLSKHQRGQLVESFDLVAKASSIFSELTQSEWRQEVDEQIIDGSNALGYQALNCRHVLGTIAVSLGDIEFAADQFQSIDSELSQGDSKTSNSLQLEMLELENLVAMAEIGIVARNYDSAASQLGKVGERTEALLALRPNHRKLLELLARVYLQKARIDLFSGDLAAAQADTNSAWFALNSLDSINVCKSKCVSMMEDLTELQSLISQLCDTCQLDSMNVCWLEDNTR